MNELTDHLEPVTVVPRDSGLMDSDEGPEAERARTSLHLTFLSAGQIDSAKQRTKVR